MDNFFDKLLVNCGQLKKWKKAVDSVDNSIFYPQGYLQRSALVDTAFAIVFNISTAPTTTTTKYTLNEDVKGARVNL